MKNNTNNNSKAEEAILFGPNFLSLVIYKAFTRSKEDLDLPL